MKVGPSFLETVTMKPKQWAGRKCSAELKGGVSGAQFVSNDLQNFLMIVDAQSLKKKKGFYMRIDF